MEKRLESSLACRRLAGAWWLAAILVCGGTVQARVRAQTTAPPPAAAGRMYTLATQDGRRLDASEHTVALLAQGDAAGLSSGFALDPVDPADLELRHDLRVRIRAADGRWIASGAHLALTSHEEHAADWLLERASGDGALAVGDQFRVRSERDCAYLSAGDAGAMLSHASDAAALWTLDCFFAPGPFAERWTMEPQFHVTTGEYSSQVAAAIDWLRANTLDVDLPSGRFPLVVWDDPTLAPESTVAYLMIDTLWASKALEPYEPDLASRMERGLVSVGWYGNGLADTLFHGYAEPAHRTTSVDVAHGTLLDRCAIRAPALEGARVAQLRVPEQVVDPAWTSGNSAQFVDSAVYTALSDHWNGRTADARDRLRELIVRSSTEDVMFWDIERWVMVDQAARCEYDAFVGTCSSRCAACTPCGDGESCFYYNASYKLGLVLYAARVTGLASELLVQPYLAQMELRLWEGQNDDGGVPHAIYYAAPGSYYLSSGATGEATAIAVLAETVVTPVDDSGAEAR